MTKIKVFYFSDKMGDKIGLSTGGIKIESSKGKVREIEEIEEDEEIIKNPNKFEFKIKNKKLEIKRK